MIKQNTFSLISIDPPIRNAEQEIEWLKENYNLSKPLMTWSLIAAYNQRRKRSEDPEMKSKCEEVIKWLKTI